LRSIDRPVGAIGSSEVHLPTFAWRRRSCFASLRQSALTGYCASPVTVRPLLILSFFCMITIRDSPRAELSANLKCDFLKQAPSTGIAVPSQMDS
jgi:hypothetical protein